MEKQLNQSIRSNPNGDWPEIAPEAYIDPTAQVIGRVSIGAGVYVGPNAVIRADESDSEGTVQPIEIGAMCNIQDGVIIHALAGTRVKVGKRTSLGHGCIIHGPCNLGDDCFIGFRAVVYKSDLGHGVFINASAIIQGVVLDADAYVTAGDVILGGEDIKNLVRKTGEAEREFTKKIVATNLILVKGYLE